ncbi:MAG: hypothetical protein HY763_03070 [Planctomycetes bacterium]|nr:hypothetical protein [Planctomycetota bacterium]
MHERQPPRTAATSDRLLSLDWAALGRRVRARTLDALAEHFARRGEARPARRRELLPPDVDAAVVEEQR